VSVRLILDTSTLRAYVASDLRAIELAELIGNVEENEDTCGIPALCLLAAAKGAEPSDRGRLLKFAVGTNAPTVILPVLAPDVALIADLPGQMPDDQAQAVVERAKHEALLGTYERSSYARNVDEDDILDLDQS
jgi:hypothetical protein